MNGLLTATLQVSAILGVALGATWILRSRTAGLRHAVVVIAMTCAAIVPLLSVYMPSWPQIMAPIPAGISIDPLPGMLSHAMRPEITASPMPAATAADHTGAPRSPHAAATRNWQETLPAIGDIVRTIYIAGVALSLAALCFGLVRLQWIAAQATPLSCNRWQRRAAAIAIALRLPRPVHLARSRHPVLATWGFARPQVLLPADAEDWPDDRIRAVLLHELAHVRRNDWAIQVLAGALRAVYWFNPLVWMAVARLRQESEQACDDVVMQHGEDGVEYAGHLLTIARALGGNGAHAPAAPSMALRSTLAQRVAVVLDTSTPHAPATRTSLAITWTIMLCVTCGIAACNGRRVPATGNTLSSPAPAEAALPADSAQTPATSATPVPQTPAPATGIAGAANSATVPSPARQTRETAPEKPVAEIRPARLIAADILELVESALADQSLAQLDEIARPITGLRHIQRYARAVVGDGGNNPATQASNYAEIINALTNTANFATNVLSVPRGALLPRQEVEQLAAAMRRLATELADAAMPVPRVSSMNVSTPERRLAVSALDVAQTAQRDIPLAGQPSNSWMANELRTLERAAQSVLNDDGSDQELFTTKVYTFKGALWSATRSANDLSRRPGARADIQTRARDLLNSIQRIRNQLDTAMAYAQPDPENDSGAGQHPALTAGQADRH